MNVEEQAKIRVVVRKRPINKKQISRAEQDIVEIKNGREVIVREHKQKVDLTKFIEEHNFTFDQAFPDTATNQQIYQDCVRPIVKEAFLGAKVTCFAYGQTGSGKTYTMNGDAPSRTPGLYMLGARDIFTLIKEQPDSRRLSINLSFYEIYCGKLFDLLSNREVLQVRQDAKQNVNIIGLTECKVSEVGRFMQLIEQGSNVRITSQNSTNSESSRSHAILQVSILDGKKPYGKISFIDLAGCERGADTIYQDKQTRMDGAEIGRSLLALKECFRALDSGKSHTPFRSSKLTMVLKDSFIGHCRTLMISNISPNSSSCQNTLNTLRYADRVKELSKQSGAEALSKQDQLARELMLPRMQKNKQAIEINSDGEQERVVQKLFPTAQAPRKVQQSVSRRPTHFEQQPHHRKSPVKNQNIEKGNNNSNNFDKMQPKRGASTAPGFRGPSNAKGKNISNILKTNQNQPRPKDAIRSSVRQSFINLKSAHPNPTVAQTQPEHPQVLHQHSQRSSPLMPTSLNYQCFPTAVPKIQAGNKVSKTDSVLSPPLYTPLLQQLHIREWENTLTQFQAWQPNSAACTIEAIPVLNRKFQLLAKNVMREEVEMLEAHKNQLKFVHEELAEEEFSLYNGVMSEQLPNEAFLDYANRLEYLLLRKQNSIAALQKKLASYKSHLSRHIACQKKLFNAFQVAQNSQRERQVFSQLQQAYQVPLLANLYAPTQEGNLDDEEEDLSVDIDYTPQVRSRHAPTQSNQVVANQIHYHHNDPRLNDFSDPSSYYQYHNPSYNHQRQHEQLQKPYEYPQRSTTSPSLLFQSFDRKMNDVPKNQYPGVPTMAPIASNQDQEYQYANYSNQWSSNRNKDLQSYYSSEGGLQNLHLNFSD